MFFLGDYVFLPYNLPQKDCAHTTCLRKIARIFWPRKISNVDLLKLTRQEDISITFVRRRWQWIGHILRGNTDGIARVALHWTPEGKRKRGRPKITWRRTVESGA